MSNSLRPPWTVAYQASLSMGFSRQEYWSGLLSPHPRVLHDPGMESESPALAAGFFITEPPGKPKFIILKFYRAIPLVFKPMSPALAGRFLTTVPPGSSCCQVFKEKHAYIYVGVWHTDSYERDWGFRLWSQRSWIWILSLSLPQ